MADFERPFTHRKLNPKQFSKPFYCSKKYILLILLLLVIYGIYVYISGIIEDYKWLEPNEILMTGGDKHKEAFRIAQECLNSFNEGSNMRVYQRWIQSHYECRKLLYYMRYGGF